MVDPPSEARWRKTSGCSSARARLGIVLPCTPVPLSPGLSWRPCASGHGCHGITAVRLSPRGNPCLLALSPATAIRSRTSKRSSTLPDLIAIQRASFEWFLNEGLAETFRDISPIKDFTETLQLELEFDPDDEDLRPPPKFSVEECKEKDMTFSAPIFVRARFMNATTGEIKEQTVFMGDFPMMTDKGTFVINGTERVVVSPARARRRASSSSRASGSACAT